MSKDKGIQIKIESDDVKNFSKELNRTFSKKEMDKVKVRSINRGIRKANTEYRRGIRDNYNLSYADTKEMVKPKRASVTQPKGSISGDLRPLSLSRFSPEFVKGESVYSIKSLRNKETKKRELTQKIKRATKKHRGIKGVSIEIVKGERQALPFAFLSTSSKPGMDKQIWARGVYSGGKFKSSKKRKPITALKTTSSYGAITREAVHRKASDEASMEMNKEFNRQVQLILKAMGSK